MPTFPIPAGPSVPGYGPTIPIAVLKHRISIHSHSFGAQNSHGNAADIYNPTLDSPVYSTPAYMDALTPVVDIVNEDEVHFRRYRAFLHPSANIKDIDVVIWQDVMYAIEEDGIRKLYTLTNIHHLEVGLKELVFPGSARTAS